MPSFSACGPPTAATSLGEPDLNTIVQFTNCDLALPDGTLKTANLWVDTASGRILDAQQIQGVRPARVVDLDGHILAPGFIDIQLNGAFGVDFSVYSGDPVAYETGLRHVASRLVQTGVTSFVPTTISQHSTLYREVLPLLRAQSFPNGANILGWHAEGPFLSRSKRGAHNPDVLLSAPNGIDSLREVYGGAREGSESEKEGTVKLLTLAPEVDGLLESIPALVSKGITVSLGHTTATSAVATAAVLSGASMITHLYNAMPSLHHREPSLIGLLGAPSLLDSDALAEVQRELSTRSRPLSAQLSETLAQPSVPFQRPWWGLIADGVHCHPHAARIAYAAHPEGCILVTDAVALLDPTKPDGEYQWDGRAVEKRGARLTLQGTDTLACSLATMSLCVYNLSKFASIPLAQAIACATSHPARALGPHVAARKGHLGAGADADLVVLDRESGEVLATWVAGVEVWRAEKGAL